MSDPVSWLLIEDGWEVVDAQGEHVGQVDEVVGDRDIFSGVSISTGLLGKPRWVPAEQVAGIEEGLVRLSLSSEQAGALGEFEPPAPA